MHYKLKAKKKIRGSADTIRTRMITHIILKRGDGEKSRGGVNHITSYRGLGG